MRVIGIDSGFTGAFVVTEGEAFHTYAMPLIVRGADKEVDFDRVLKLLDFYKEGAHVFLEKAVSFGMGTKGAFNYGRAFGQVETAIRMLKIPCTYVEPSKWTKEMHAGLSNDLKPKVKSLMAVERLFPKWFPEIPRVKGKPHDGTLDALLINEYGRRLLGKTLP